MGKWEDSNAAAQSGDSSSSVARAEHDARDDATVADLFERGNDAKNSQPFSKTDDSGQAATSFWGSIFGSKK